MKNQAERIKLKKSKKSEIFFKKQYKSFFINYFYTPEMYGKF